MVNGAPERIRTSDPQIRSLVLYADLIHTRSPHRPQAFRSVVNPAQPQHFGRCAVSSPINPRLSGWVRRSAQRISNPAHRSARHATCPQVLSGSRPGRPGRGAPLRYRAGLLSERSAPRHRRPRSGGTPACRNDPPRALPGRHGRYSPSLARRGRRNALQHGSPACSRWRPKCSSSRHKLRRRPSRCLIM